eukprot:CAMPEP_0198225812 /NCGR_PEP_ID=MMETSP1445-20131203/102679_1 /TAXON_ID=36898 /ORGANISM="Pyramimonas sp., Strain CCMP2087" /LENGTH=46 /DNA_ID= /DNA_START= /DNA_END= /DNA_ORIENTATION=
MSDIEYLRRWAAGWDYEDAAPLQRGSEEAAEVEKEEEVLEEAGKLV